MMDEGYIKFKLVWTQQDIALPEALQALNTVRRRCVAQQWIGMYEDGIGFGNISVRVNGGFLISGTQTGHLDELQAQDTSLVTRVDIAGNTCWCTGRVQASSESMTHAALYATQPGIGAVIHIHHQAWWAKYLHVFPTTPQSAAYGTPDMAKAIAQCAANEVVPVIIMAGHPDGILAYGTSLEEAWQVLWDCMPENVK